MTWLTDDELRLRLRDLESQWVERKQSAADRSGIRRNICAFANDLAGGARVGVYSRGDINRGSGSESALTPAAVTLTVAGDQPAWGGLIPRRRTAGSDLGGWGP